MLKFTRFISLLEKVGVKSKEEGTYVCVYPNPQTIHSISDLCQHLGVQMMRRDTLHCTVLYSRKQVDHEEAEKVFNRQYPIDGVADELALFDQQDNKKCLVLKISSVKLRALHVELLRLGGTHDYPSYEAHITLCRDLPASFKIPKLPYKFDVRFNRSAVKVLDEGKVMW